jgi:uncharacterized protein (DUF433 family)
VPGRHGGERSECISERQRMEPERLSRITIADARCRGRRAFALELLGAGATFDEILEDYPYLEREDILAAIQYPALQADHQILRSA